MLVFKLNRPSANHLPASSGTTTKDFMAFFLFWLISLPAIWFPIHKMYDVFLSVSKTPHSLGLLAGIYSL